MGLDMIELEIDWGGEEPTPMQKQIAREEVVLHADGPDEEFELLSMLGLM